MRSCFFILFIILGDKMEFAILTIMSDETDVSENTIMEY